jgi:hypothetical protein
VIRPAFFLTVASAALALACAGAAAPPRQPATTAGTTGTIAFETIVQQSIPGQAGEEIRKVARDEPAWRALWAELRKDGGTSLPEEPPAIDFTREMAIVTAMPTQSCVSKVTVQSVVQKGGPSGEVVVTLLEAPPAPNCRCIVAARPIHAVRLPLLAGTVRFVAERGLTSCGP